MRKPRSIHASDLHGLARLGSEAVAQTSHLVEAVHRVVAATPIGLTAPVSAPVAGITNLVYRSIRGVNALVAGVLELALRPRSNDSPGHDSSDAREALLAVLNGIVGDHLERSGNPLAIRMQLRAAGKAVSLERAALQTAYPQPAARLLVLVHGLCMNDRDWSATARAAGAEPGVTLPERLARELGYTPLHLHYNSGRHVSQNGREFATLLDTLLAQWPQPVQELAIVAHSMGGLVARSACHFGLREGHDWPQRLRHLVFLGTPHHGAPLERGGNWIDRLLAATPYSAPFARLGKLRSAGITDLRQGYLLDEDWQGRDRFARAPAPQAALPLPPSLRCYVIAGSRSSERGAVSERLLGDGLVPVDSALGRHTDPNRHLDLPATRQWVGHGIGHIELLHHPDVHARVLRWLTPRPRRRS